MSHDETEHRTPEGVIASDWRLQVCAICDKDRVSDEPGDVYDGGWICWACLETAPCDKCDGEHNPLGPCPADATNESA